MGDAPTPDRQPPRSDEERALLARLREHCAALGWPVDDFTDEELGASIQRLGELMRSSGVTVATATAGLLVLFGPPDR